MTEPETPEEVLTVPVVNVNYLPEGIVALIGVVPGTPIDDPTLVGIKANLEEQGHISGEEAAAANEEAGAAVEAAKVEAAKAEEAESEPTSEDDTSTVGVTESAQPDAVPYVKS